MTPENATQLAGAVWSAVDRKSLEDAVGHIDEYIGREQARWQEAINGLLLNLSLAPERVIDGSGCDSGDPLDLTLTEIRQAFEYREGEVVRLNSYCTYCENEAVTRMCRRCSAAG